MENDNIQATQDVNVVDTSKNEATKAKEQTFTQADMDNLAGKVRGEEKIKSARAIEEAVANAIAEYDRRAKLTEAEREKEAKAKRENELKERENNITLRENRVKAQELLSQKHIPIDLVDFVVDLDESKMQEKINMLVKTYNKSVEVGITDKLKSEPPKDYSKTSENKRKYSGVAAF